VEYVPTSHPAEQDGRFFDEYNAGFLIFAEVSDFCGFGPLAWRWPLSFMARLQNSLAVWENNFFYILVPKCISFKFDLEKHEYRPVCPLFKHLITLK
jgi:hypothetical protein